MRVRLDQKPAVHIGGHVGRAGDDVRFASTLEVMLAGAEGATAGEVGGADDPEAVRRGEAREGRVGRFRDRLHSVKSGQRGATVSILE